MKNNLNIFLTVAVLLLAVNSIRLSLKLSTLSQNAQIDHLKVRKIELVGPSDNITGEISAGNNDHGPCIKLLQWNWGNECTLGFAGDNTGPVLEMISESSMMPGSQVPKAAWPQSIIRLGAVGHIQQGLWIRGRESASHEMMLGWEVHRKEDSGEYVYPCSAFHSPTESSNKANALDAPSSPQ